MEDERRRDLVLPGSLRAEPDAVPVEPQRASGVAAAALTLGILGALAALGGGVVLVGSYASWTSPISPLWGYGLLALGAMALCITRAVGETTPSTADGRLGVFLTTRTCLAPRAGRQRRGPPAVDDHV